MREKQMSLWEVLEKYADIRDELEDVLFQCAELQDFIDMAREEISDGLEQIQEELNNCDKVFRRYKVPKEETGLPFPEAL